jgi:hypothetical protein
MEPSSWRAGFVVLGTAALLAACGGPAGVTVTVAPATATLASGDAQVFTATVTGATDPAVTWQTDCGALVAVGGTATLTTAGVPRACGVTARSVADDTRSAAAAVTLTAEVAAGTTTGDASIASSGLEDEVLAVAVGPGGVVAFGGATSGQLTTELAQGGNDGFVVLREADGSERWRVQFGDKGEDAVTGLALRDDGVVVAVGYTADAWPALPLAFVIAFDGATGTTLWKQAVATPLRDVAAAVAVDASGRAYVAGTTHGSVAPFTNAGFSDVFVARIDPDGMIDGFVQFGGPGSERAHDLALLPDGDVVLVGYAGGVVPGAGPDYLGPAFAVRFTADLAPTPSWVTQAGENAGAQLNALAVGPDGDLVAAGYATGQVGADPHGGDYDLILARIAAADGALSFVRQVGGATQDYGRALAVDDAGRAWVGGVVFTFDPVEDLSEAVLHVFGPDDSLLLREVLPVGKHGAVNAIALAEGREVWLGGWTAADMPGARFGWDGFLLRRRY